MDWLGVTGRQRLDTAYDLHNYGRPALAISLLQPLPTDVLEAKEAHLIVAKSYRSMGKHRRALRHYLLAQGEPEFYPGSQGLVDMSIGETLLALKRPKEALVYFERAISGGSTWAVIEGPLAKAKVLTMLGRFNEAETIVDQVERDWTGKMPQEWLDQRLEPFREGFARQQPVQEIRVRAMPKRNGTS